MRSSAVDVPSLSLPFLAALLLAAPLGAAAEPAAATAAIEIDAAKPGPRINPRLYGIFLEEINHGVDGGLYAELIRNRGFEDAKPPEGFSMKDGRWVDEKGYDAGYHHPTDGLPYWSLVQTGDARGSMHLDVEKPLNEVNPRSLRLDIAEVSGGRVGVANGGFWGIAARKGEKYELSFHARCGGGFSGPLTATLEGADGKVCAGPAKVEGLGPDWKKFTATLTASATEPKCRFVLTAGSAGTVWLDFVSLFPAKTFRSRPSGLREDIARLIAELKPGFVRFPGGCVVEGGSVETAYNWKSTVGPVEARPETWGAWNYRRTHGMGFLEYLQFCEDIGAEPLHVGFAGQTCLFRHLENVPMSEMGWVADNFLHAIEYANGDSSTPWGARRIADGRAQPFGLRLVEIGNENGTADFPPRYQYIHRILKAKHPEISCIADLSWIGRREMGGASFDIEDNHFYNTPRWFIANEGLYDRRDRSLPPVYVGEVAVTSGEGGEDKGNLLAALAEGVFLMGLERNADVVKMVSYAPLLAHVSGRTGWHGMIYFDSSRVFGTVSYYLWKLFGTQRPDFTLKTAVAYTPASRPAIAGSIGVGTWDTSAEFKDIRVAKGGEVLYASDFARGAALWRTEGGEWSVEGGAYRQGGNVVGLSFAGDESWTDYTLTLKARKLRGAEGFLIAFGSKGEERFWWNLGGWGNREHGIEFNRSPVGRRVPGKIETDRWYDLKVQLEGRRIRCWLDGALVHDENAPDDQGFFASAGRDESSGDIVIKAINTAAVPVETTIRLSGVERVAPRADLMVLSSERLSDNNSLDRPDRVVPAASGLDAAGSSFAHRFPPFSLSVLRLKTR